MSKAVSKILDLRTAKLAGASKSASSGSGPSLFCTKRFNCVKMLLPKTTAFFLFAASKKNNRGSFPNNRFKPRS